MPRHATANLARLLRAACPCARIVTAMAAIVASLLLVGASFAAPPAAAPAPAPPAAPPKPVEVEFRLVPFDQPDAAIEKLDRQRPIVNPVSTARGVVMQQVGIDVVCWARNVLLDGKPMFERYHEGRYIDRLPIAKAALPAGDHTLWPGDHVFTIGADGAITTTDPELTIAGSVVRIKAYPLTIRAFRANPEETDLPMSMRAAPLPNLTVREAADVEATTPRPETQPGPDGKPKLTQAKPGSAKDLLPLFEKFAPLTVWLPAHTTGQGYVIHPIGLTFHLGAKGVVPGAGGGESIPGLRVAGNVVEIPVYGYPAVGDAGTTILIPGVESLRGGGMTTWNPRRQPYEFRITDVGPSLPIDGQLVATPVKSLRAAIDPVTGFPRGLVVEMAAKHFEFGQAVKASIRALDPGPAVAASRAAAEADRKRTLAQAAATALQAKLTQSDQALKTAQADEAAKQKALEAAADDAGKTAATAALAPAKARTAEAAKAADALRTQTQPAQGEIEALTAAFDAAKARLKEVAELNAAAEWRTYARLRPLNAEAAEQEAWTDLAVTPAGPPHEYGISLPPTGRAGVYELEVGAGPTDQPETRVTSVLRITVAAKGPAGVGLFTQRGRDAFFRGESFWIALAVLVDKTPLPAGSAIEAALVDAAGKRWPLLSHKTADALADRDTFILRLAPELTRSLAPGKYRVEASAVGRAAAPLSIEIIDPEPATHFTNLLNGKYNGLGGGYSSGGYSNVLGTGQGAEELARHIRQLGYNAFMGMSYGMDRVNRPSAAVEQLVRDRRELGPAESYYQPSGRDRFMNAAVRQNLRFYEDMFTMNDTQVPRAPLLLDASERYVSLEVQSMRFNPAFRGACMYDEFYYRSTIGIPTDVLAAIEAAFEQSYREKYRDRGLTGERALRAFDRYLGRPAAQRSADDLNAFRTWAEFEDQQWSDFSTRMAGAAKEAMPRSFNFTLQRFWGSNGGNLSQNGPSEGVHAPFPAAASVMYKDGGQGDRPAFAAMEADALRVRDDIQVWPQLHAYHAPGIYSDSILRGAFFALSQKVDGFTYFTLDHNLDPSHADHRDTIRNTANRLTTPYGDFLMSLGKGYKQVAVYYSRGAEHLNSRKPASVPHAAEGLWVACARAGFPADFIYDGQLLAGKAMEYQVVFAPGFTIEGEAPPAVRAALARLVNAGKTVIVERSSKLDIEGLVRVDSELDEYEDRLGGAFPRYVDQEFDMVFDLSEQTTKLLRETLPKYVQPAAEHHLLVGPDWLKRGQGQYMVLPNFADTGFTGTHKTLYQAPDAPILRFPRRPSACYDVLEMKRLEPTTDGQWMTLQVDMRLAPGKIVAFLPAPIERVDLHAPATLAAGADLAFFADVVDKEGKAIDASFPVEVSIVDPQGKREQTIFRAAAPRYQGLYRLGANAIPGAWQVRVRELISGKVATARVTVSAAVSLPAAALDSRPVRMAEPSRVEKFLAGKDPVVIALDVDQAWARPQAERLRQALASRGREARIAQAEDLIRLPGPWGMTSGTIDGTRLWRGQVVEPGLFVDASLVLIGKRYENRLVEALVRRDVLPEPLTPNFPGPGRALVDVTLRAFSNKHDTLSILSVDEAGLARGIDAALAPSKAGTPLEAPPVDATQPAPPPGAGAAPAGPSAPVAASAEPDTYSAAIAGPDWVRALDVDPATGRSLLGTQGYGHNLFCLGPDGKPLWKQFLPEHNVYFAAWIDGGKRVVAATGRGFFLFILDGADGHVIKKLSATEWPEYHGGYMEGPVNTETGVLLNHAQRTILIAGKTGVVAIDFDGKKLWALDRAAAITSYPKEAEQTVAAQFGCTTIVGPVALSPDGTRLAYGEYRINGSSQHAPGEILTVWQFVVSILDARTGKVLAENADDPGIRNSPGGWGLSWPADAPDPLVHINGKIAPVKADGSLGPYRAEPVRRLLPDGGKLQVDRSGVTRLDPAGKRLWRAETGGAIVSELDTYDAGRTKLFRVNTSGLVTAVDMANGAILYSQPAPPPGAGEFPDGSSALLRVVGDGLLKADKAGHVTRLGPDGKPLWSVRLADLHELPGKDYAAYVHSAVLRDVDATGEFFPVGQDAPDDYAQILRPGIEQLVNGSFESADGWTPAAGKLATASPGKTGNAALVLDDKQLVTQKIARRVVPSATYLLEFFYKADTEAAALTAGVEVGEATHPILTATQLHGRPGQWTFARVAIKTPAAPTGLTVGFESSGGRVMVDDVSLKPVRFPSANLLANAELAAVEPTFVRDIRVQYERLPAGVRDRLMRRNHVAAFKQGASNTATIYTQEQAYLHNGRLDDVGEFWAYPADPMGFSVVLTQPAYVSHLVLYLNNATPENVYQTISILANNPQTKLPESVALVRGNHRRFVVVHFPKPVLTDSIKILPMHPAHRECLTEVEVYGPLGGPDQAIAGFTPDPDAVPMFMGSPTHVPAKLPADLVGEYAEAVRNNYDPPAFNAAMCVADDVVALPYGTGSFSGWRLPEPPGRPAPARPSPGGWGLQSVTALGTPARYGGRLLVGSADYKLHAVADNGAYLWGFQTGGRVRSSPLPSDDDVYVGSDDGKLYKVDVQSGALIWEFATGGPVRSSPALAGGKVYVASGDGFLYALDASSGLPAWKQPLAPHTRSSPALAGGKVFIGDEQGNLLAFDAASGAPVPNWKQAVAGYVSGCPVVAPDGVFYASEQGEAAFLGLDGALRWKRPLGARVSGQPLATQTQVVVPTEGGLMVLRRSDGQPDDRFKPLAGAGKIQSVLLYRDWIVMTCGAAWTNYNAPPRTYAQYGGAYLAWKAKPPATPAAPGKTGK
ncbi:MAG: PQQ-binding-like beta-propeller repeat protein [Planctomycetota bacterium]|nr:PQQ-binding-like beta-propeller repeat protein [Planctomycetota bacterium]